MVKWGWMIGRIAEKASRRSTEELENAWSINIKCRRVGLLYKVLCLGSSNLVCYMRVAGKSQVVVKANPFS